jgi:tetratricopeptide (TPR) repeat protein
VGGARPRARERTRGWEGAQAAVALALLVAVPLAFDSRLDDGFALPKLVVLAGGAAALGAALALRWALHGHRPRWGTGMHWATAAVVAWAAVATVAGVDRTGSVLGRYQSYDGLVATAAGAVVFVAVADAVGVGRLRVLATALYLGAGGPAVVYGLLQLHDRFTTWGGRWDPFDSDPGGSSWVWSTFGNPNHMAGYLAMLLPLGAVLLAVWRNPWLRSAVAAVGVGAVVLIAYSTSRGAWLGAAAGVGVLAALLASDVRAHRRATALVAGGLALAAVLGASTIGAGRAAEEVTSIVDAGGTTTLERTEFWLAAVRMAVDRPLTGVGPDGYSQVFHEYQGRRFVEAYSPRQVVRDAHGLVFTRLASAGFVGLGLFVALLVLAAREGRNALRELAREERRAPPGPALAAREQRLLLAAALAALAAFVVQGMFNVHVLELSVTSWGLLGAVAGAGAGPATRPVPPRKAIAAAAVAGAVAVVALVSWACARAYLADHRAEEAGGRARAALALMRKERLDEAEAAAARAVRLYGEAAGLWSLQAEYRLARAQFELVFGDALWKADERAGRRRVAAAYLEAAVDRYADLARDRRRDALLLADYARALGIAAELGPPAPARLAELDLAIARAREANPHDAFLTQLLLDQAGRRLQNGSAQP